MKSISRFVKGISLMLAALSAAPGAGAQVPTVLPMCSGTGAGKIYFTSHDSLFVMDPVTTSFSYAGITVPIAASVPNAQALAVSANINGGTPSPTYYTTLSNGTSRIVHYWNGSTWTNTGGILNSDHIAGGGGYLFSYDPASGFVFRYSYNTTTGTGTTTFLQNAGSRASGADAGPEDIATDCSGNFYVLPSVARGFAKNGAVGNAANLSYDTTQPSAFANRVSDYHMQVVYTAADLAAAGLSGGTIDSMAFNIATLGDDATNGNFTVKMSQQGSTTGFPASLPNFIPAAFFTTVYSAPTYTHTSSGLQKIIFSTPFFWDGSSSVVVDISYTGAHLTNNARTYFTPTSSFTVLWDSSTTSATGTVSVERPNTVFWLTPAPYLKKYNYQGTLLANIALDGNYGTGGGGLAINGNNVYYDGANGKLYSGVINGTTVTFSASSTTPFASYTPNDFGSCGYAGYDGDLAASDTMNFCNGANTTLTATGPGPYNWTVVSGNAVISGSGATVRVTATQTSVITHLDANCSGTNAIVDTTVLLIANANINAGPDRTLYSCGSPLTDSLRATISNTTSSLSYAFNWSTIPAIPPVIVGSNTDTGVVFQISNTTRFVLDVSTITKCHFRDTVLVTVIDSTPKADFQYLYKYGCSEDTVIFFNYSTPVSGIDSFAWDFRDSVGNNGAYYYSDAVNPTHIFKAQGFYNVTLLAKNAYCQDTITKQINVSHPILPDFTIDDTTQCSDHLFQFTSTSILPCSNGAYRPKCPVTFKYDFGDGATANTANPTHRYTRPGTYTVTLTLSDTLLHCTNSKSHTVVVDSLPFVSIVSKDTSICQGQAVHLVAKYLSIGNTGIDFDLGDGTTFQNTENITYAFLAPGTYNVTLTAHYRYCPDASITVPFTIRPFPGIDIGDDTVMCPNGSPLILSDRANLGNTSARYLWSTGETTPAIAARNIGLYWARVDVGGCTATDSLLINRDCYIEIPNSFTPNGDGNNDYFLPRQYLSRSLSSFKMTVFNRWGQKIFETSAIDGRGWDGKFNGQDQPFGVYVYQVDVTFDNGTREHYTGNVTLLR